MKKQHGMTLIEVMVALVIMATGILGAVAMQTLAKKGSFDAMQRSVASSLAQDMLERMRVNVSANNFLNAYNGTYGGGAAPTLSGNNCQDPANPCTPGEIAAVDIFEWEQKLRGADVESGSGSNVGGLVNARGCINHSASAVTIIVSWEGKTELADSAENITTSAGSVTSLATACGTSSDRRRQVIIEAVIF